MAGTVDRIYALSGLLIPCDPLRVVPCGQITGLQGGSNYS